MTANHLAPKVKSPKRLSGWKVACVLSLFCAASPISASAQTFTTLVDFDDTDGALIFSGLIQGVDGNFYGTSNAGGTNLEGTVFRMTPQGDLTVLHSFVDTDGAYPQAGLVQGADGNFYGTTVAGGATNNGTIFRITPEGTLTTLYQFTGGADGGSPITTLTQAVDGDFYGTTYFVPGGSVGTVFKITSEGKLTTLYTFCVPNCTSGAGPATALIQATDGNFYGTTNQGGRETLAGNGPCGNGCGTVFRITPSGELTTIHHFTPEANSADGLVQGSDGNLYGSLGAKDGAPGGTIFRMTLGGELTTLYTFCTERESNACVGGYGPAGIVQGSDGNLYGATEAGGDSPACNESNVSGCGTLFELTLAGTLTTLHTFSKTDGSQPAAALVQGTDGTFYGTTLEGGPKVPKPNCSFGCGTIFNLDRGLGPLVKAQPNTGVVGQRIVILGNNLTTTTGVSFNGTAAGFTVVSDGEITADVPAGASTGTIQVTTTAGTLVTTDPFRVRPHILSFSPASGAVGTRVVITGNSFTGTESVHFGGVEATSFVVDSDNQITATVPTAAPTGAMAVCTSSGSAQSTANFTVSP